MWVIPGTALIDRRPVGVGRSWRRSAWEALEANALYQRHSAILQLRTHVEDPSGTVKDRDCRAKCGLFVVCRAISDSLRSPADTPHASDQRLHGERVTGIEPACPAWEAEIQQRSFSWLG